MADKIPHHRVIHVYGNKPKPMDWEESLNDLLESPPIQMDRERNSSPELTPLSQHSHSHRQQFSQDRVLDNENIPPPSTQPRRPRDAILAETAAPGGEMQTIASTQHNNKEHQRVRSESPEAVDGNEAQGERVAKRQRLSSDDEVNLLEERVVRIAESIDRLAAEAKEASQEFSNTLKELLCELQRRL